MNPTLTLRRAPGAPDLPVDILRFVIHALRGSGLAYGAMVIFETLAAASGIMTPYALSRIIQAVTGANAQSMSVVDALTVPLTLFFALAIAEVVFGRLAGAIQIRSGPRLRQGVVRSLYHFLQRHSHRYMSSHFAGALAHRISETSMGALQLLWIVATEFWPIMISIAVATVLLFQAHHELGLFVMAVSLSLLLINEARNLARRFLELFDHAGNVANGIQTIVRDHEIVDLPGARAITIEQGHIRFDDVSFDYNPEAPVFNKLSVDIPAGQRVGLVGRSGSGKSSFVNLLLRLYDVKAGRISIDGTALTAMTLQSLHAQVALIPQDPSLFHRSLIDNIRYGKPEASDNEVVAAARKAHAHEFIERTHEGYGAMVGERGVKLSGGQRQRIAIARVILKDAPVLILDEATSALDSLTEQVIQLSLIEAMRGKTVIVVAHRLSTIAHLDRILVFDRGRIVEDGSHAELLAVRGAYWQLWSRQAGGFLADDAPNDSPLTAAPDATGVDADEALSLTGADDELPPLPRATP